MKAGEESRDEQAGVDDFSCLDKAVEVAEGSLERNHLFRGIASVRFAEIEGVREVEMQCPRRSAGVWGRSCEGVQVCRGSGRFLRGTPGARRLLDLLPGSPHRLADRRSNCRWRIGIAERGSRCPGTGQSERRRRRGCSRRLRRWSSRRLATRRCAPKRRPGLRIGIVGRCAASVVLERGTFDRSPCGHHLAKRWNGVLPRNLCWTCKPEEIPS